VVPVDYLNLLQPGAREVFATPEFPQYRHHHPRRRSEGIGHQRRKKTGKGCYLSGFSLRTIPLPEFRRLALASAYSIVKHHGGAITVSSRPGKGTRLNVFLPVEKKGESNSPGLVTRPY